MPETSDRRNSTSSAPNGSDVTVSEASALIQEASDLIHASGGMSRSSLVGFHERKAALFEALAAAEPWNVERREVADNARAQLEALRALGERRSA
jgi:hypothetical protein